MIVDLANVLVSLVVILSCFMLLDLMVEVLTGFSMVASLKSKAKDLHAWRKSSKKE